MRNTEQILKSVGLLAYELEIGSLQECNDDALSKYDPENFKADWITVKLRPGQQTATNNISFASCSGQLHSITCYFTIYQKCIFILWKPCLERLEAILKIACFGLLLNFAMGVGGHGEKKQLS